MVGPHALHLDLPLGIWAADGLLAIFFFVAGLELKREFVAGDLRDPRRAALPVVAAIGGMAVPAARSTCCGTSAPTTSSGWAIPTATDIAFAVAVLAVISTHLPSGLRTFLLTLAVVDDLLAITVIAIFYTDDLQPALPRARRWCRSPSSASSSSAASAPLVAAPPAGPRGLGAGARVRRPRHRRRRAAGLHRPVARRDGGDGPGLAEHLEHLVRPISAGVAVPVFAFFAAGVHIGGLDRARPTR